MRFQRRFAHLEEENPQRYVRVFVDWLVQEWTLVRPALRAAVELGAGPVLEGVERVMDTGLDEFVQPLRAARPDLKADEARGLGKAMRRTLIGAMLDRTVTRSDLRQALLSIVGLPLPADQSEPAEPRMAAF